jgi:hypothetical protein
MATTVPAFVTGNPQRVNNESPAPQDFAGHLSSHKRDAHFEMIPQNLDQPLDNMGSKKWMRKNMTLICVMPAPAQELRSTGRP